ncbi:MAG: SRPBCC family protein [Haloferacaceae archaeon]
MHTFEHTVEIAAPVEHVFAFDSDPENWTRTMASMRDLEIIEETEEGARMRASYTLLGISTDLEMELTVVEPNEHIVVTMEGDGVTGELHNYFAETDSGTQLRHHAEYDLGDSLFDRIVAPVASSYNDRQLKSHLENTKDMVEAEVAAETAAPA